MRQEMTAKDLYVGMEVRVFARNVRRTHGQPGGEVGVVIRVGRKLVDIKHGWSTTEFRIETQQSNDSYGWCWFKTVERAELDRREGEAIEYLRGQRIELRHGHALTLEQLEALAGVVHSFFPEVT